MSGAEHHNKRQVNAIPDLERDTGRWQVGKLIDVAPSTRDKAFVAVMGTAGLGVSETLQLNEDDIDFKRGTLTIVHLAERSKLKCPRCGGILDKRHFFCPNCGDKVDEALHEKVQQRHQRVIPIDGNTLRLLQEYLKWRQQFPYRGPLVFPFTRQRSYQITKKLGRHAGLKGLHPSSFRQMFISRWITKGLDTKKLAILLGHASYIDSAFKALRSECRKMWEPAEDEERPE